MPGKQSYRDRPGVQADKELVKSSLSTDHEHAFFLASTAAHSGDWLLGLPIVACGLRLEDEAKLFGSLLR